MKVEVKDLKIGDEVILPAGRGFRFLKVLKEPEPRSVGSTYKSVRCSANIEVHSNTSKRRWDQTDYTYTWKEWHKTFEGHNTRISVDMNYKDVWLVKRDGEYVNGRI